MNAARARFYRQVETGIAGEKFSVLLDGKAVKTPGGNALLLPTRALAEAIADEWRAQAQEKNRVEKMELTRLANTAIDRVALARAEIAASIAAFGKTDHLCYRADKPEALRALQAARWDPLLEWARTAHGIGLVAAEGIVFIVQPEASLRALETAIAAHDDFALAGLQSAAAETGSAILGLALASGHIDAPEAHALSRLDEDFQAELWGRDDEAEASTAHARAALAETARFLLLSRDE